MRRKDGTSQAGTLAADRFDWTEPRLKFLRDEWRAGKSAKWIAEKLGCTRNAVIGKAHRLLMDRRASPIIRDPNSTVRGTAARQLARAERAAANRAAKEETKLAATPRPRAQKTRDKQQPLPIGADPARESWVTSEKSDEVRLDIKFPSGVVQMTPHPAAPVYARPRASAPKACTWPIGDPKQPGFRFCEAATEPGRPYCSDHCRVAYSRKKEDQHDQANQ